SPRLRTGGAREPPRAGNRALRGVAPPPRGNSPGSARAGRTLLPQSASPPTGRSRRRDVRSCLRPAGGIDLVHGVEQNEILHVRVLLEHRGLERLPARPAWLAPGRA